MLITPVRPRPVNQPPDQAPATRAAPRWLRRFAVRDEPEDRGSSSVEFTILFPIIIVLLLGGPQLAMWYFAREAAQSGAAAAARAASVVSAMNGDGKAAAETYLTKLGTATITSYSVDETDSASTVTIHIHVTVPNAIPLPGFTPSADVTVSRAKERFTTPDSP